MKTLGSLIATGVMLATVALSASGTDARTNLSLKASQLKMGMKRTQVITLFGAADWDSCAKDDRKKFCSTD